MTLFKMVGIPEKSKRANIILWLIFISFLCCFFSLLLYLTGSRSDAWVIKMFIVKDWPPGADSWKAMIAALNRMGEHTSGSVYDEVFAKGIKFQYPLTSLLIFDLPHKLTGISYDKICYVLNFICRLSVLGTGFVSARILTLILKQKRFGDMRASNMETVFLYILPLLITCVFYPLLWSYNLGQIQTLLTFLSALSILCWLCERKMLTGLLIGIICIIKPQLVLLLIWAAIRKQWSMLIPGMAVILVFFLIAVNLYGFHDNIDYLRILSFLSHRGESYYANQSINGLVNRLLFNGENLKWDGRFPPYSPIVYTVTLISSMIFMLFGLLWNYKHKNPHVIDFCIMLVCTTIASPIAWEHHYGVFLTIFFVLFPFACYFYADRTWMLFVLIGGFLLISRYIETVKIFAYTSLNILQSYLFFGACIMLFFLFSVSRNLNKQAAEN